MGARGCLLLVLSVWLLATIARQAFDLIGRLWVPVLFNLIQLLCCISGLFAVCQRRRSLLLALCLSSAVSLIYNILLLLWWCGVFGERDRPLLSAGLPYSYSFWTRYTPFCTSYFNLTSSRWVQAPCPLPFYHIEAAEAIVHALLACATIAFALTLVCRRRGKRLPDLAAKQPTITVQFSSPPDGLPRPPDSLNDHSSGYMNSSYEDAADQQTAIAAAVARPQQGYASRRHHRGPGRAPPRSSAHQRVDERARSVSPHRRHRHVELDDEAMQRVSTGGDDAYSQPRLRHASARNYRRPVSNGGVRRMLSHEQSQQPPTEQRNSYTNLTSLISFDPKSNTLIRVREHNIRDDDNDDDDDDDEEEERQPTRTLSHDSMPSMSAPPAPADRGSYDSGVPDSSSVSDWPPPPRAALVGYEPALHDATPPIAYDSRFAAPQTRRPTASSSGSHYHSPDSLRLMAYDSEPRKPPATVPIINHQSLLV